MGGRKKHYLDKCSNQSYSIPNRLIALVDDEDQRRGYNCKSQIVAEALDAYFADRTASNDLFRQEIDRFKHWS